MRDLKVTQGMKNEVDANQTELKNAIRSHQDFLLKLKENPDSPELREKVSLAEREIIDIGIAQKALLERLREEYKVHQQTFKTTIAKTGLEERRFNLSSALSRARKQNIVCRSTSASISSFSDDSAEAASLHSSPEHTTVQPVNPHDVTQPEYLSKLGLCTHDVYKELQNKRVERKRRSTANPHFLYGNKGWDVPLKRKKAGYLYTTISPPNTRQAVKKKNTTSERVSPPLANGNAQTTTSPVAKSTFANFPPIPNLPSGLTIERVSSSSSSPDPKVCVTCRQPGTPTSSLGALNVCDNCTNGYHVSCHNRPLTQSPRQCPRCITKELRTVGSLNVPSGMSVSYVASSEFSEKLEEKRNLEIANKSLSAELTQLQDRHSQLTISLKNQQTEQENLRTNHQSTEDKIQKIVSFINSMKNGETSPLSPPCLETQVVAQS